MQPHLDPAPSAPTARAGSAAPVPSAAPAAPSASAAPVTTDSAAGPADRGRSGWLPDELVEGPAASSPLLVELIDSLRAIDRLTAKVTGLLELAHDTGEVEEITGLPVELWLSAAGRRTRTDRRMLSTAAVWRRKLPSLADAFDAGRVSWAQVRAIVCACIKVPTHLLDAVDGALAREVEVLATAEPDALVHVVSRALASIDAGSTAGDPDDADGGDEPGHGFLAIQPRLDGTGGSLYGETDSYGLAVLTEALDRRVPPPDGRVRDQVGQEPDPDRAAPSRRKQGRRRMTALLDLAERSLAGRPGTVPDGRGLVAEPGGTDTSPSRPVPTLLLTMTYETLAGLSQEPGELLTTLTDGRLKIDAGTARRLVDERGAQLRTIVLEETGQVLGVGRAKYRPPGWLRDALLVRDATCRAPGCRTSARRGDLDHAVPWDNPDGPPGPTDVSNLAHVCRTDHGAKDRGGWQVTGQRDGPANGLHRWHHVRSGLTIDTAPATRRLPLPAAAADPPGDPP